jgi:type II secretory pathway component PulM
MGHLRPGPAWAGCGGFIFTYGRERKIATRGRTYQIMPGMFSVALVLFDLCWTPLVQWSEQSQAMLRRLR